MTLLAELYACLYAEELPVQALLRLRPELRDKPCVVMDGISPLQQVCSINKKARRLGVAHAMTRVEIDTYPSITVLQRSHIEEAATRRALLASAGDFSPRVEAQSRDGAFLCFIDLLGTEKLLGSPEALTRNLLASVQELGVSACAVISRNANAAAALAKGQASGTVVKIIPAGEEAAALASLPLSVLDLTEEQREIFTLWGIHTLGILADLSEKELVARLGQSGQRLRQLARGELPHSFQPSEPAFALEEWMGLDSPVEVLDALLFVVNGMLEQLIRRAESRSLALASITMTLTLEGLATHTCTVRTALPTNERQLWIKLLHLELDAHPPPAAILTLAITAEPGAINDAQLGLLTPPLPEPARLDVTLARIRAIVGDGCVGRPALIDTHQPQGIRVEPFTASTGSSTSMASFGPLRSAIRALRPAENISVTVQNNTMTTFIFREIRYIVKQAYRPWLISGGWWNQPSWSLEQWDVVAYAREEVLPLCCCVVFHDLMQDRWQISALHD